MSLAEFYRKKFGTTIRAARNCFYKSDRHGAYIRISRIEGNEESFLVEVCPEKDIVDVTDNRGRKSSPEYLIWTDTNCLDHLKLPQSRFTTYVNYEVNAKGEVAK